ASLLMLWAAQRLARRRWPFIALGALVLASVLGIVALPGGAIVWWSGVIGFANAAMFTISYPCAVAIPILAGIAWDATGLPDVSFAAIGLCAAAIIALAATVDLTPQR